MATDTKPEDTAADGVSLDKVVDFGCGAIAVSSATMGRRC